MRPPPHPREFKGTPAEWQFWRELYDRYRTEAETETGWEPDPGEPEFDRDITKDRCRACGRLRGSVEVEYDIGDGPETFTEFPDPCLGWLPGAGYACCGHGRHGSSVYVNDLHGPAAARKMRELGGNPPPVAFLLDPIDGPATGDV